MAILMKIISPLAVCTLAVFIALPIQARTDSALNAPTLVAEKGWQKNGHKGKEWKKEMKRHRGDDRRGFRDDDRRPDMNRDHRGDRPDMNRDHRDRRPDMNRDHRGDRPDMNRDHSDGRPDMRPDGRPDHNRPDFNRGDRPDKPRN